MSFSVLSLQPDYEERTIEFARGVVDDIPECAAADYRVRFFSGVPMLILAFHLEGIRDQPALAIRLVTISRSQPLTNEGQLLEGDRLKRHIRTSVDNYLHKHGIRIPDYCVN